MGTYKITYLHHSGFVVETDSDLLVFDYYLDPKKKLEEILRSSQKPLYFFVSHSHSDHFNPKIADFEKRTTMYYLHKDCMLTGVSGLKICAMSPGDLSFASSFRVKMYGSTDTGGSFLTEYPQYRFFHAGDLNWWHWAGEDEKSNFDARNLYFKELSQVREEEMDIVFFPVDARQEVAREWGIRSFLERKAVRKLLVPMHAFGSRWVPSYGFRWRFPDTSLWIPKEDGDGCEGDFL